MKKLDPDTSDTMASFTAYWVDLRYKGGWGSWCSYSSVEAARTVRDHFKGISLLDDYCMGPCDQYTDARVREVVTIVRIDP